MNITGTKSRLKIWGKPKEEVRLKSSCLVSVSAPMEPPSTCFGIRGKGETLIARRSKHTSLSRNFRYSPFKKNYSAFDRTRHFPKNFFLLVLLEFLCVRTAGEWKPSLYSDRYLVARGTVGGVVGPEEKGKKQLVETANGNTHLHFANVRGEKKSLIHDPK